MSGITFEDDAWTDPRFDCLAQLLGLPDRDLAMVKVGRIWKWQTDRYTPESPTYIVPRHVVIGVLGIKGPEALVESGLAELADGGLRMAGSEGRIEWKENHRRSAVDAGRARAAGAKRSGGRFMKASGASATSEPPANHQRPAGEATSGEPALTSPSSFSSSSSSPEISLPPARAAAPPPAKPGHPVTTSGAMAKYVDHAIDRLNQARREQDPKARPIPLIADQPCRELVERLAPLPPEDRMPALDHALDVLIAEVRTKGNGVDDLRMAMVSGERAWPRLQAATVAGVSRRRDGPQGGFQRPPEPARRIKTLYAPPPPEEMP